MFTGNETNPIRSDGTAPAKRIPFPKEQAMNQRSTISSRWTRGIARSLFLALVAMLAALPLHLLQPAAATAAARPQTSAADDALWAKIDAYVEQERQGAKVPGVALAIVQGDRIVHLQGFGEADPSGRAVTPDTPFSIGSGTKSFTALAIMQLVEAGKIELDAPVQRYLPWFRVADPEASAQITVRHLLQHTAGFPKAAGNNVVTRRNTSDSALEDQVRSFITVELNRPVGSTWEYSNAGYTTLGLVVQTVSGQGYERYVEEHIFAPLGMQQSFTDDVKAKEAGLASGYRYWFGMPVAGEAPFPRGALPGGFLMSSGEDLAHYMIAHLNDGRYGSASLLSPAGIAALHQGAAAVPESSGAGGDDMRYGMGWYTGERNGMAAVWHPGDTSDFHADMLLVPEGRWGIALLMNSNNRVTGERMRGIVDGVTSLLHGQQPPAVATSGNGATVVRMIMALAVAQALVMIRSTWTLRRFVRRARGGAVTGWLSMLRHIVLPLALYLLLALTFLLGVPTLFGWSWALLLLTLPDVGTVALVSGVLALGWAIIRSGVALAALRRRSRARLAGVAAHA